MNLKDQRNQLLAEARATVDRAKTAGRDLTPAESKGIEDATAEARNLDTQLAKIDEQQDLVKQLGAMGLQNNPEQDGFTAWGAEGRGFLRLAKDAGPAARRLSGKIARDTLGRKALVGAGVVTTAVEVDTTVIPLGEPAHSIFDVVTSTLRHVPNYAYLQQSARVNNAAVVLPGAAKPVSVYSIIAVQNQLDVIAHLSEPLDEYLLADNGSLSTFIAAELSYGLIGAVETRIIADINTQSGVQVQAYATDLFTTTRKSVTAVETLGVKPAYWLMNPADWEKIELVKNAVSGDYLINKSGPVDVAARRLWGAPVVTTGAVTAASCWLIGEGGLELSHDGMISLKWSAPSGGFEKNEVVARCEGRFATDCPRPWAVVKVALA